MASSSPPSSSHSSPLKFLPFSSTVESSFWVRYSHRKLETIKLSEDPLPLVATYGVGTTAQQRLQLLESSLDPTDTDAIPNDRVVCHGSLLGLNTLEAFSKRDKNQLLKEQFERTFWKTVCGSASGGTTTTTTTMNPFQVLTFADLKQHKVLYWFGFPAWMCQTPIYATLTLVECPPNNNTIGNDLHAIWSGLPQQFHSFRRELLLNNNSNENDDERFVGLPPCFVATKTQMILLTDVPRVQQLLKDTITRTNKEEIIFGFIDPTPMPTTSTMSTSTMSTSTASSTSESTNSSTELPPMGWPLRNLIAFLALKYSGVLFQDAADDDADDDSSKQRTVSVVSWRAPLRRIEIHDNNNNNNENEDADAVLSPQVVASTLERLLLLQVTVPTMEDYLYPAEPTTTNTTTDAVADGNEEQALQQQHSLPLPFDRTKVVGWELNARHKPGPRWVNLKPLLDSTHLAIQAADLNLKLMKWRMIPSLQVEQLQRTRVLLLGAGTLGCSVARTLLGWGIRNFTFVDNGTVSYSNPCRQNLFTLEDCHYQNGTGKPKAQAAADALTQIAADVQATGVHLSIPMPGHTEQKQIVSEAVTKLDALIQECDVVYLLTDTRESRWLPTIMAAAHNTMLINAALGLDSWLVMRHGGTNTTASSSSSSSGVEEEKDDGGTRLGCYFCNDVVAPENSTKNRTLDQQCTVTRPGLAPIAASMAVELMVALLHHPLKQRAQAPSSKSRASGNYNPSGGGAAPEELSAGGGALGVMPHQIRGSLVSYQMMTPTVPAFGCCTGCSPRLIDAYHADKLEMVHQVCQATDSSYLEDLTGLTAFRADAADKIAAMEDDDDLWDDDE
jgi:ubiquitin-like modifier-activating enzyme ATG7